MGRFSFVIVLCFLFIFSSLYAADDMVNFSGVWAFNEAKSDLGEGSRRRADLNLTIKQEGNTLSVERVRENRSGEQTTRTENLTLDGKECKNIGSRDREILSVVNWTENKKGLVIKSTSSFEREGETFEIKTDQIWTLSEDGNVLTIDYTSTSPRGERKSIHVYDKQEKKS
jgi:hypothetical protein